jgi:hypothetical protein
MGTQYRHGDVLIEETNALPTTREKLPHPTLAHGEVTGHTTVSRNRPTPTSIEGVA